MQLTDHDADSEYLARKASNAGYRTLSLITPPLYTAYVLVRRGRGTFSLNGLLQATWIGGAAGAAGGACISYARYKYTNPEAVKTKRIQVAYNTNRIRAEDHATIGSILFSVLTPAILWKRAKIVNLILGGAGIGSGIGSLTHYIRTMSGDPPPVIQIPNATPS
ncbi:hypothetical protein Moror_4908 [Moniliophthora roreri MCA 2997]|uniref:Uncharacterized protein n=2 Tax=Moniliophthora roreri TaxID=221103 RepID=V2WPG0_MONRO|nr:hypothetical protein Moror_4908 [Moniliophthora roreri MCA 2997]KAI3613537.1 hypothetical protein WG66_006165 [Moniliophthora roreri]